MLVLTSNLQYKYIDRLNGSIVMRYIGRMPNKIVCVCVLFFLNTIRHVCIKLKKSFSKLNTMCCIPKIHFPTTEKKPQLWVFLQLSAYFTLWLNATYISWMLNATHSTLYVRLMVITFLRLMYRKYFLFYTYQKREKANKQITLQWIWIQIFIVCYYDECFAEQILTRPRG